MGLWGLSLEPTADGLLAGDQTLWAWVRVGTLFLPDRRSGLLDGPAPGTFTMSIQDGFELGRLTNRAMFGAALAAGPGCDAFPAADAPCRVAPSQAAGARASTAS